jgi:hypothetical protein
VPARYDVDPWRLALGLLIGAVAAVAYFAIPFGEAWPLVAAFAVPVAAVAVAVVAPVAYVLLRRRQLLNVYAVVLIGGAVATLPCVAWALAFADRDRLTLADSLDVAAVAAKVLLWFFGGGAIGAGVAWLIGVGFRVRPPRLE